MLELNWQRIALLYKAHCVNFKCIASYHSHSNICIGVNVRKLITGSMCSTQKYHSGMKTSSSFEHNTCRSALSLLVWYTHYCENLVSAVDDLCLTIIMTCLCLLAVSKSELHNSKISGKTCTSFIPSGIKDISLRCFSRSTLLKKLTDVNPS